MGDAVLTEPAAAVPRYPTVHVEALPDEVDEAAALLFELGATGVEERDATTLEKPSNASVLLVAHFDDEDRARIAIEALPYPATLQHVVGDDWKHRWREFFKASRLGERIVVRPPWEEVTSGPRDVVITIDPGQAFGTGTHETTRLVLAALDRRVVGGERVLDVGCGSGILSIGALLLGAESAVGIDVERESVEASHENAVRNGVAGRLRASLTPLARLPGRFSLVVANVESRVLVPFAREIAAKVEPGGLLILSGLLFPEEAELILAYPGFDRVDVTRERDWIAITLRKHPKPRAKAKAKAKRKPAAKAAKAKPRASAKPRRAKPVAKAERTPAARTKATPRKKSKPPKRR